MIAVANRTIGYIYWQSGDEKNEKAKEIHYETLEKAKEIDNKEEIGEGLRMIGYYHADDKDYEKAYELYKQAEQIAKDLNNKNLLGKTYNAFETLNGGKRENSMKH